MAENINAYTGGPKKVTFASLISHYSGKQKKVQAELTALASATSGTNPAQFLMMQFEMAKITQMGDSISNFISVINSMINNSIRNQKGQ